MKFVQLSGFMFRNCVKKSSNWCTWCYHSFNCLAYYNDWTPFHLAPSWCCLNTTAYLMKKWHLILVAITEKIIFKSMGFWLILKMSIIVLDMKDSVVSLWLCRYHCVLQIYKNYKSQQSTSFSFPEINLILHRK